MLPIITVIAIALGALAVIVLLRWPAYRGSRIVSCPETNEPVAAEIDALLAARTEVAGGPRFVISNCSRWPERAGCDQSCAPQIAASPRETLVRNIVTRWYRQRHCAYCGRLIADIGGTVVPGLRDKDGDLREWCDVAPQDLPRLLGESVAVCAPCELAESFRRDFPARVIERPRPVVEAELLRFRHRAVY